MNERLRERGKVVSDDGRMDVERERGRDEQCRDQETPGRREGDEWGREQENWTGGGERMKMEKGCRYQETEIVSCVQVINKAGIDRYLQRGRRRVAAGHAAQKDESAPVSEDLKSQ